MGTPGRALLCACLAVLALLVIAVVAVALYRRSFARKMRAMRRVPAAERHAVLRRLYEYVVDAGEATGARPYLLYGSLLGQQREGRIICWDYDVDFGVAEKDYSRLKEALREALAADAAGPYRLRVLRWPGGEQVQVLHRATELRVDVSPMRHDPRARTVRRAGIPRWALRWLCGEKHPAVQPAAVYYPLRPVDFMGRRTYVPADPKALLASYYGPGYMTPDSTCTDAGCPYCASAAAG